MLAQTPTSDETLQPVHPLGKRARVLLSSVFGPYAQDDEHGSRAINPMELYQNQVTRVQDVFSLRMFHRSWGLMLIHANLDAPATLLDFPSLERFTDEIRTHHYDVVGISGIWTNLNKVARMCSLVRAHLPRATVVVGGHVANVPGLRERIDADHVVRGDGVRWFRKFLNQDQDQDQDANTPIRHPLIPSGHGARTMGLRLSDKPADTAATLIPSAGCPMGCNFCSTSSMFGGKGKFVNFLETGDELFSVMSRLEAALGARSFFVMDENFLLYRKRALRLLELMRSNGKAWSLYVFSSANALRQYSIEQLVGLGVSWLWIGLEGEKSEYAKLRSTDTRSLVRELQSHGIRILGSSIIGLLDHSPENIDAVINHAVAHDTDFHQFMLYTPVPGTDLYKQHAARGTLLGEDDCPPADSHGQSRFNFRHPRIPAGRETDYLLRAFERDFDVNGPSVLRITRTLLQGWMRYKDDPDARVRERYRRECCDLPTAHAGALWAARKWLAPHTPLAQRLDELQRLLEHEFGVKARLAAPLVGRFILARMRREHRRLRRGWSCEPPTFYEINEVERSRRRGPAACHWVTSAPLGIPVPSEP